MKPIKNILVPVDFGPACEDALNRATDLASAFGASITVLHVYELALFGPAAPAPTAAAPGLEQIARDSLRDLMSRHRVPGVDLAGVVREGEAWLEILAEARVGHADLIVMGTHGRTGIARALLGSVAERVVRHADVPVLTVHKGASVSSAPADYAMENPS
jgi:nucleotide-binding universal stress UspA family protein